MGISIKSQCSIIFHQLFGYNINDFFQLVVHAQRYCLNLTEEQPVTVIEIQTRSSITWHAKISLNLNEPI